MPKPQNDTSKVLKNLAEKKDVYVKYEGEEIITWCHGCGNFNIQNALKRALTLEGYTYRDVVHSFDIGCNGNGSDKIGGYTIHGLHGRSVSLGAGAALGNSKLKVIASGGDGGTMSEGIGHLVHSVRSDYPMLFVLHNNHNYGLTTGQASATTPKGFAMNGSPDGVVVEPMNPSEFVLGLHPTFVARSFSGDIKHMTKILRKALKHKGFAFVEILQVCPTYNRATPQEWYWDRIKYIEDLKKYDSSDLDAAKKIVQDFEKDIYLGVLYNKKNYPPFQKRLPNREGVTTSPHEEVKHFDTSKLQKRFE